MRDTEQQGVAVFEVRNHVPQLLLEQEHEHHHQHHLHTAEQPSRATTSVGNHPGGRAARAMVILDCHSRCWASPCRPNSTSTSLLSSKRSSPTTSYTAPSILIRSRAPNAARASPGRPPRPHRSPRRSTGAQNAREVEVRNLWRLVPSVLACNTTSSIPIKNKMSRRFLPLHQGHQANRNHIPSMGRSARCTKAKKSSLFPRCSGGRGALRALSTTKGSGEMDPPHFAPDARGRQPRPDCC